MSDFLQKPVPESRKKRVVVRKKSNHELEAARQKLDLRKERDKKKMEKRLETIEMMKLRATGASYQDIADHFHLHDASHAKRRIDAGLTRTEIDAAKEVVALDLLRLDEYQMRVTHALRQNGDLGQVDRLLRIMEFRYRLLGVNEETVRSLQSDHGIHISTGKGGNVMVVQASPETSHEFISKMMQAVGVDPNSKESRKYIATKIAEGDNTGLPMLEGSANDSRTVSGSATVLDEEVIEAEIVEEL